MTTPTRDVWRWHRRPGRKAHLAYPSRPGVFLTACEQIIQADQRNNDPTQPCKLCQREAQGMLVGQPHYGQHLISGRAA
jgi:hypothetical protein